jgi:hypothetical protein
MAHPIKPIGPEIADTIEQLRAICLDLPGATEKLAWGEPTFRAPKMFAMVDNDHHNSGHLAVWVRSTLDAQDVLVDANPDRFFVPPYMGKSGWIGIRIGDPDVDWGEVIDLIEDGYRLVAPKKLLAELDAQSG